MEGTEDIDQETQIMVSMATAHTMGTHAYYGQQADPNPLCVVWGDVGSTTSKRHPFDNLSVVKAIATGSSKDSMVMRQLIAK